MFGDLSLGPIISFLRIPILSGQGVQCVTAENQAPSPIDFLGAMKEAVAIEKRLSKAGVSKALRDVLSRCVGEYNRMCTRKNHKVDTPTKNMVMNLFLGSQAAFL